MDMRWRLAGIGAVAVVLATTTAASSAAAAHPTCGTWTRYGHLTNETGQTILMWDADGKLRRQVVAAGQAVPFRETWPWRVSQHMDVVYMQSLDYSGGVHPANGWASDQDFWVMRPAVCPL